MKYLSYFSSTLLGLIFLFSALAKAWDAEAFADMLLQYGPQWFSIGAPIVICIEVILAMALLLRIYPIQSAFCTDCFLIIVSIIFAYGVLEKGIEDCGCFGIYSKLFANKPWITFIRNILFVIISIPIFLYKNTDTKHIWQKGLITIFVTATACFICGLSMKKSYTLPKTSYAKIEKKTKTLEKLNEIYTFDKDSTYIVYLFSFSCQHCQNSFANVQQFQQFNVVDKIVGIAIEDSTAMERFYRIYKPEIEIITIPKDKMWNITNQLPIGIFIKNNSIIKTEIGSITSPGLFIK